MSLSSTTLKDEIRKFADPTFGSFTAFPTTPAEAKTAWGTAFFNYISQAVANDPITVTPNNTSLNFAGVAAAFSGSLVFDPNSGSATTAATEISNAWAAGISATIPVIGADYFGEEINPILTIAPFIAVPAPLLATLLGIFNSPPSNDADVRLGEISDALHSNTLTALVTTCTYTIPSSSPGDGTLGFG